MIKVDTPDVVCCEEERKFYISFKDGHIRVGYQDSDPFMEWTDPEPWKVGYGLESFFGRWINVYGWVGRLTVMYSYIVIKEKSILIGR